jgi:amino acid adenylation domain-containing protein
MPGTRLLHRVLREGLAGRAEKVAVRMRGDAITYEDLDRLSNQIGRTLQEAGVPLGGRVGIYASKSIGAVAALLGVLKAGAVCVPLDPDSPVERLRYIIQDCELDALVVDDARILRLVGGGPLPERLRIVQLGRQPFEEGAWPASWTLLGRTCIEAAASDDVAAVVSADDLAYILYTSGSTGQPKGVMLTHRNTRVFVDWAIEFLGLGGEDVFSSHAPLHFDLSILDIYAALGVGGTLCLVPPGTSYFPDALAKFVEDNAITVWYSVPSAVIQILCHPTRPLQRLRSIKTFVYAGEVFPFGYLNELRRALPETTFYNFYGPTETNVITAHVLPAGGPDLQANVPIGHACSYAEVHVLDSDGAPVLPGRPGELAVTGGSLMRGYWRDPAKTARAIRTVELEGTVRTLYFTGDLVRQETGGALVYLSRRDSMVKTRGFRVELGEIETALDRHAEVVKSAVVALPDEKIGHRLFAYVAVERGEQTAGAIESHCATALPAYMVPERIFCVERLPLTSTGKIDRDHLKRDCEARLRA